MLSRDEAKALLLKYGEGRPWTRHCFSVADAAEAVGSLLRFLHEVNVHWLWSAALLHDIGRYATHDPIIHGVEGYHLLMGLGHEEEAFVCASHVVFGLHASEAVQLGLPDHDFLPVTYEQRIVPLVDYLLEADRPTTLERRFASLRERNAGDDRFLGWIKRAQFFRYSLDDPSGSRMEGITPS